MAKSDKRNVAHLINLLLEEPKINEIVRNGLKPQARNYEYVNVDIGNTRVYFGKYSWSGFSGFWNNLIKCCDHITFDDFFIKTWDALVDMTVGTPAHEAVLEGLSRETLLKGIHNKEYDWIVDRFFDVCRHLTNDGYWKTIGTKTDVKGESSHHVKGCPYSGGVQIEVEPQRHKSGTVKVVDCVGDVFEILTGHWVGGRR